MDDREVIDAFVNGGARRAFSPSLHVEGDCLLLDGWWHTAFRVAGEAFILRNEEAPRETNVLDEVAAALSAKGLRAVGTDLPAITVITYTQLTLGYVSWNLWAVDLAAGESALAARAGEETFFEDNAYYDVTAMPDNSAELGGARRLAGLPPSILLTVGVSESQLEPLRGALTDCRFMSRALGEITPDACGSLIPTLVLVDATDARGREFVMELRAAACGRTIPVVAVTDGATVPLGADAAVDPAQEATTWVAAIRHLLP